MSQIRLALRAIPMVAASLAGPALQAQAIQPPATSRDSVIQRAWQNPDANRGPNQISPGYVRVDYVADRIIQITAREAMNTTIRFPADELIEDVYLSDPVAFEAVIPRSNVILLRAIRPGADGNLVAFGRSGNLYQFYVRAESTSAPRVTDLLVDVMVRGAPWRGVGTAGPASASGMRRAASASDLAVEADWLRRIGFRPENIVHDLAIFIPEGDSAGVVPERVFRDHQFTYIDYGANADSLNEWPVAALLVQGVETPVNTRTAGPNGRMLVVEGVGDIVLRNGQKVVCIRRTANPQVPRPPVRAPVRATLQVRPEAQNSPDAGAAPASSAPAATPATTTVPPAVQSPANMRRYLIALDTGPEADLRRTWQTLKAAHHTHLASAEPQFVTTNDGLQLRAGPFHGLQAGVLACRAISSSGKPCTVIAE